MKQSHTDYVIQVEWLSSYDPCGRNEYETRVERFPEAQLGAAELLWEDITRARQYHGYKVDRATFLKVTKETETLGKF